MTLSPDDTRCLYSRGPFGPDGGGPFDDKPLSESGGDISSITMAYDDYLHA